MPAKEPEQSATPSWMIARKTRCKTCGSLIKAPAGVSLGAAVRRHYWRRHRDVMTARRAEREWDEQTKDRRTGPALAAVPEQKPDLRVVGSANVKKKKARE